MPSSVLGRRLPSITDCGFWETEFDPPLSESPTRTILTDVGNDIFYGADASDIGEWVETTLNRVLQISPNVAMTQLPMQSLRCLTERRYRFFRRILFPRCQLSLAEAMQVGDAVNQNLESLSRATAAALIEPPQAWYGIDPIHVRKRFRPQAWSEFLAATCREDSALVADSLSAPEPIENSGNTLTLKRTSVAEEEAHQAFELKNPWFGKRLRIWRHKPLRMWRKNVELVTGQPTAVVGNSELWLF
jgi:hypothetical protein